MKCNLNRVLLSLLLFTLKNLDSNNKVQEILLFINDKISTNRNA